MQQRARWPENPEQVDSALWRDGPLTGKLLGEKSEKAGWVAFGQSTWLKEATDSEDRRVDDVPGLCCKNDQLLSVSA